MTTFPVCKYFRSVSCTSAAFSLTGNARCSASTLILSPRDSKKSFVAVASNWENVEKSDFPFFPYLSTSRCVSYSAFKILQRPPPVISNFFPRLEFFSRSKTCAPSSAARPAAIMPAGPPPMIRTSKVSMSVEAE